MKILFILDAPPYGTERSFDGLRLVRQLASEVEVDLSIFLMSTRRAAPRKTKARPA